MTDTKPSERATDAAGEIAEFLTVQAGAMHDDDFFDDPLAEKRMAAIIDEHCPECPGYDELQAACKELMAAMRAYEFEVDCAPPGPHIAMMARAKTALAAAKGSGENPNGN